MTGLVVLWCLAQAPSSPQVAVVVSSKRPGADVFATTAAQRVHAALLREGVPPGDLFDDAATGKKVKAAGFSDARNCNGGASCLAKLALLLGPNAIIVGVDVGKIGGQLAVRLEAFSAQTAKSMLVSDVTVPVDNWGDKVAVPITLFARQLAEKVKALAPPPPPVVKNEPPPPAKELPDAPVVQALTPPPTPPPAAEAPVEATRARTPAAVKWTLGIAALGVTGASIGLLVSAVGNKRALTGNGATTPDDMPATHYTAAEASALANSANTQFSLSLGGGILAALLTAAAVYFFASE